MRQIGTTIGEIRSDLPGILLLSHGRLASGLLNTLQMVFGDVENVTALELEEGDNPEEYQNEIAKLYEAMPDKTIFLMDIFGGSPFNQVMQYFLESGKEIRAISGMNLGMLAAAISAREDGGEDFVEQIALQGKEAVIDIGRRWKDR